MRTFGWIFLIVGLGLIIGASSMTTSIHTGVDYIPGVGIQEAKDVYNLGLLQKQMMLFQSGLALFVLGVLVATVGQLRNDMREAGTAKYEGFFESLKVEPAEEAKEAVTE